MDRAIVKIKKYLSIAFDFLTGIVSFITNAQLNNADINLLKSHCSSGNFFCKQVHVDGWVDKVVVEL